MLFHKAEINRIYLGIKNLEIGDRIAKYCILKFDQQPLNGMFSLIREKRCKHFITWYVTVH